MSYLVRWVRQNQTLASRSASLLASQQSGSTANTLINNHVIKPLYQVSAAPLTTSTRLLQKGRPERAKEANNGKQDGIKDDIKYQIKFKELDVKKVFKDFYSLYGPLFIVCHVGIGLCSLGFFCSLVYFTVDLSALIPDFLMTRMSDLMVGTSNAGGKFVMAYAIHKVILPLRLTGAIWLTRLLSPHVNKLLSNVGKKGGLLGGKGRRINEE